jgi:hypothetical protein
MQRYVAKTKDAKTGEAGDPGLPPPPKKKNRLYIHPLNINFTNQTALG